MKKRIVILIGIMLLGCSVFSQDNIVNIDNLNKLYCPYNDSIIEFNIVGPKLLILYNKYKDLNTAIGKSSTAFHIIIDNDKYKFNYSPSLSKYLLENQIRCIEFQDAKDDIDLVLKYLKGFLYGTLFEGYYFSEHGEGEIVNYIYYYEYKGIECKNVFTFKDTQLLEMKVYTLDSINPEVSISYGFEKVDNYYYLTSFKSKNYRQDFLFNYSLTYSKENEVFFPKQVIVEVVQKGKSISMQYILYNCKSLTPASTL